MSKVIKLKRGLDINLQGKAEKQISDVPLAASYGISPSNFEGVTPKLLVKVDDVVKAGSPLFFDKNRPEIIFTSPVSGTVAAINRGEKRKILDIVVNADSEQKYEEFEIKPLASASREDVIGVLLSSGLWPFIIQRPYGIIANPEDKPKAIFVSGYDSAPLAPDLNFVLADRFDDLHKGFEVLAKLTEGKVHLGLKAGTDSVLNKLDNVEKHLFEGPHPAGNVGVQIHHINPINKGEVVWTADVQAVAIIGRFFNAGKLDLTRVYAVTGSEVATPKYVRAMIGTPIAGVMAITGIRPQPENGRVRIINGNVLTGSKVAEEGYVDFYNNQLTVIPEGDKYEFLGWAMPRLNEFSVSRSYFSWLRPHKSYVLDTNLHGGVRPFVVTGLFERYVPMDIYPMYLLKAILAGDIDKMENLGIYEVIEEDFALCEFVDPSKTEIQQIVRQGINLMIKELN